MRKSYFIYYPVTLVGVSSDTITIRDDNILCTPYLAQIVNNEDGVGLPIDVLQPL